MKQTTLQTSVRLRDHLGQRRTYASLVNALGRRLRREFPGLQKTNNKANWYEIVPGGQQARLVAVRPNIYVVRNVIQHRLDLEYEIVEQI